MTGRTALIAGFICPEVLCDMLTQQELMDRTKPMSRDPRLLLIIIFVSLCLLYILLMFSTPALSQDQMNCNDRNSVRSLLSSKYQEELIHLGTTNNKSMVEVYHSEINDSWTIVITTYQNGAFISCLIAAGEGWRNARTTDPQT